MTWSYHRHGRKRIRGIPLSQFLPILSSNPSSQSNFLAYRVMSSSSFFDSPLLDIKGPRKKAPLKERPPVTKDSPKRDKKAATRVRNNGEYDILKETMMRQELPGRMLYAGKIPVVIEWAQNQEKTIAEGESSLIMSDSSCYNPSDILSTANKRITSFAAKLSIALDRLRQVGFSVADLEEGLNTGPWIGPEGESHCTGGRQYYQS